MADPIGKQHFSNQPVPRSETQTSESTSGAEAGAMLGAGLAFAAQLAGKASAASPYGALPGLVSSLTGGGGGLGGVQNDIAQGQAQMMEMLRIQNQMQLQNQQFTTMSNVSKMDHDTRMAAVRNIRT